MSYTVYSSVSEPQVPQELYRKTCAQQLETKLSMCVVKKKLLEYHIPLKKVDKYVQSHIP